MGGHDRQPDLTHLRAYGCKVFCLSRHVQRNLQRKKRLLPSAHIGFLVGYSSSNIFRIWVPRLGKVMSMRDVKFNEDNFYSKQDIEAELTIEELTNTVESLAEDEVKRQLPDGTRDPNNYEPFHVRPTRDTQHAVAESGAEEHKDTPGVSRSMGGSNTAEYVVAENGAEKRKDAPGVSLPMGGSSTAGYVVAENGAEERKDTGCSSVNGCP